MSLRLLYYRAKYSSAEFENNSIDGKKVDMRSMKDRIKNVLIHDQDIIDKRWDECQKCEFLTSNEKFGKEYHRCQQCGCFMKIGDQFVKTRIATASCPIGKWDKEYSFIKDQLASENQPEKSETVGKENVTPVTS